jgi:hypothetical protein
MPTDRRNVRHNGGDDARPRSRRIVTGKGTTMPRWLREDITRVTRKDRLEETLYLLDSGTEAFADGRYRKAYAVLSKTKELSPRADAVRELLALSAYRAGMWKEALAELRTFRRLTGDTTHMPIEMDVLRALRRGDDVRKVWAEFLELGGRPETVKEAKVVYGSFLIDEHDLQGAWKVVNPKKLTSTPFEEDLRQWFVAARTAALLGDRETALRLIRAIDSHDPSMPGLEELRSSVSSGRD